MFLFCAVPKPTVPPPGPDEAVPTAAPGENYFICEGRIFCLVVACLYSIFCVNLKCPLLFSLFFLLLLLLLFLLLCYIETFFLHHIGPIGAAASRPRTRARPGEFHVIFHLRLL